jgi:plastocyanin
MSVRRCLSALAIATTAAACAASAADAKTKVVVTGGPPPKASQAGSVTFPAALDLNGFFRKVVTIHVGDSVKWQFSKRVVHTVTFLDPGQSRPALETQDPANPYSGFNDSQGVPMWFNGQPGITIPPDHAFPQGGATMGAKAYHNSGLSAPQFQDYKLQFTKKGSYKYICLVHPGMSGRVKVLPKGATIPSAKADRKARVKEYKKAVKKAKRLAKFKPKGNNVVAGHDQGNASWFRFFPSSRTIKTGESVHFSIGSKSEIHTMTFGPQPSADLVLVHPQPAGPPLLQFNPFMFLPSDVPPLPPYTGSNHGDGFFNTGIMDTNPQSPPPSSVDVTFTNPGTYLYECTIHPGMQATINVQ